MLNVSDRSVRRAGKVQAEAPAEIVQAVDDGRISVSLAAQVASLPESAQAEIIAAPADQVREVAREAVKVAKGEKEILAAAKAIRAEKAVISRGERLQKIDEISRGNTALDTATKYPVIYADPPWRYENPPMGAGNRAIENHYPTMTLEEICAMPVAELAADDASNLQSICEPCHTLKTAKEGAEARGATFGGHVKVKPVIGPDGWPVRR